MSEKGHGQLQAHVTPAIVSAAASLAKALRLAAPCTAASTSIPGAAYRYSE